MRTIRMESAAQIHHRRGGVFELFVDANLFFFQGPAGIPVSSNLPSERADDISLVLPDGAYLDAGARASAA